MVALVSVWIGLLTFLLSVVMLLFRSAFADWSVLVVLWIGSPAALCLALLVLWSYRKEGPGDPGIDAQRTQCKVAVGLALVAAVIVYGLVIGADRIPGGLLIG